MQQIDEGISRSSDLSQVKLTDFARIVGMRYSTYNVFARADVLSLHKPKFQEKLRDNLKNSLVSKAYVDQNCYVKCRVSKRKLDYPVSDRDNLYPPNGTDVKAGINISCMSGCFNEISREFDKLYGFDGNGVATRGPVWVRMFIYRFIVRWTLTLCT